MNEWLVTGILICPQRWTDIFSFGKYFRVRWQLYFHNHLYPQHYAHLNFRLYMLWTKYLLFTHNTCIITIPCYFSYIFVQIFHCLLDKYHIFGHLFLSIQLCYKHFRSLIKQLGRYILTVEYNNLSHFSWKLIKMCEQVNLVCW